MSGYYSSYDVKAAVVAFAVMMVAYLGTMAPTVTLEQSGAMVVAADSAGIGKFPGFPIWHLLAHGFTWLFSSATYRGQPNPAFATNVMSVWFGALACGTVALLVSRLTRSMMPASREVSLRPITSAAAIASAMMFGFTPAMWSQSVITETHSLTNFYAAAFLAVLLYWVHTRCRHGDLVVAFLFGLALSVSQQLGLFAPVVLLAAAWCGRKHLVQMGVAMLIVGLFIWGVYRAAFFVSIWLVAAGGGVFIAVGLLFRPTRRSTAIAVLFATALLPHAYIPIAAARNPPMNMGFAHTWEGFWHLVGRGQDERVIFVNPFREMKMLLSEIGWLVEAVGFQFMIPLVLLGFVPLLIGWMVRSGKKETSLVFAALISFAVITAMGLGFTPTDIQTRLLVVRVYIPVFLFWSISMGCGMVLLYELAGRLAGVQPLENKAE